MHTPVARTHRGVEYCISQAHPEADRYPWLDEDELDALADDIQTNQQKHPIRTLPDGRIVDGRNREIACRIAGVNPRYEMVRLADHEIRPFIESMNLHRRHLSAEFRRQRVAELKSARMSNRAIAAQLRVDERTVRRDLDSGAAHAAPAAAPPPVAPPETPDPAPEQTPATPDRVTGQDGKSYPASRPKRQPDVTPAAPHPFDELMAEATGLSRRFTQAMSGTDPDAVKLRQYLSWAGLVDNAGDLIEGDEYHGAKHSFLPLRGVRKLIQLAKEPGPMLRESSIKREYDAASGGWVPPLTARRRSMRRKAG